MGMIILSAFVRSKRGAIVNFGTETTESALGIKLLRLRRQGAINMKDSTKDKVDGTVHELKGKVKEKVGHATNNPNLEEEGNDEKVGGKIQKKVGDIEKVFEK
jgi:uncharacterized protein YjbJ (UPF0337 family)